MADELVNLADDWIADFYRMNQVGSSV